LRNQTDRARNENHPPAYGGGLLRSGHEKQEGQEGHAMSGTSEVTGLADDES